MLLMQCMFWLPLSPLMVTSPNLGLLKSFVGFFVCLSGVSIGLFVNRCPIVLKNTDQRCGFWLKLNLALKYVKTEKYIWKHKYP